MKRIILTTMLCCLALGIGSGTSLIAQENPPPGNNQQQDGDGGGRRGNRDGRRGDRDGRRGGRGSDNDSNSTEGIDPPDPDTREEAITSEARSEFIPTIMGDDLEIRSYDGSGNNQENPSWGATFSQLQRLAPVAYDDGIASIADDNRMSAREISNMVAAQETGESVVNVFGTTDFLWQWGQFIDHDLGLTDGSTNEAVPIIVPTGDPYFDPSGTGEVVINFNRAVYDPTTGTSIDNPRQQENQITSWIDGSMVYGSDDERAAALREGPDSPFLKTSEGNLLPFNSDAMPNANGFINDPTNMFIAGDVRANEQVGLTIMHTLFVREHNRLAALLQEEFPDANADEIFERARRLVIAEIQIITYDEYLPALLGENTLPVYAGYNPNVNPNMYNEFTVAAYRFGHSELSDQFLRLDENGNEISEGHITLADAFFSGVYYLQDADDLDPFLRGFATQAHQAIDLKLVNNLRNFLFGLPGQGGFDLAALNIQRGRDHGVASYNDTREAMGLPRVTSFEEVSNDPAIVDALRTAYATVDNIDLWVGGLAETPLSEQGSQLGELFTAIIVKQFDEIRAADRFWYTNDLTSDELALVEDVTMANIVRNNTNIGAELQDNVFIVAS